MNRGAVLPVLVSVFVEQTSLYTCKSFSKPGLFFLLNGHNSSTCLIGLVDSISYCV